MVRPRTPFDPRFFILLMTAAVVVLSGCMGTDQPGSHPSTAQGEDDGDNEGSDEPAAGGLVPAEVVTGAERLDRLVLEGGGAVGYVFDGTSRNVLEGVRVIAQCEVPGVDLPIGPQVVTTDPDGTFAFSSGGSLQDCERVTYQALMTDYAQVQPVASDPLVPGQQYRVFIALQAT